MAWAQPDRHFDLSWQAPAGCSDATQVASEIDELIASSSARSTRSAIVARALVTLVDGGFKLELAILDDAGWHERKLEAPTCNELSHATALIIALAIDPTLLATPPGPGGSLPANSSLSMATGTTSPHAVASTPPMPHPQQPNVAMRPVYKPPALLWRLGFAEFVDVNTMPGAHLYTGLFGAAQSSTWRLEAMISELSAQVKSKTVSSGAFLSLYRFAIKSCWLVTRTNWSLGPCLGVDLGLLHGEGYGVQHPRSADGLWFDTTLGTQLDWRLGASSSLGLVADAHVPWVHEPYQLSSQDLYEPPWLAVRAGLSLSAGWR